MKNLFLSPGGRGFSITHGNRYRASLSVFELNEHMYEDKAWASVKANRVLSYEEYLLSIGFALFSAEENILPEKLSGSQVMFCRAHLHDFSEDQSKLLLDRGVVTQAHIENRKASYYKDLLADISAKYEKTIFDTYGNTHDFNRDRSTIEFNINKLSTLSSIEDPEERRKAAIDLVLNIRFRLVKFQRFAEGEV